MGRALIDIARTSEDKEAVYKLIAIQNPADPPPDLANPLFTALIVRDEETEVIVGTIIVETATIVRNMHVDPNYAHSKFSITLLHNVLESLLRIREVTAYYFTVPLADTHLTRLYERAGAEAIEKDSVRFLRRL